jgi:hypothetical protein
MNHSALRLPRSLVRAAAAVVLLAGATLATAQQRAGEVLHLQGMATAQQPGGGYRFLGKGDAVLAGDVISTTDKGFAVVSLEDGSKFTLRPSTTFALDRFTQQQTQGSDSLAMRLVKGGMRFVSGLVGKRNPGSVELRVNTATIGIRGTSFDARICGEDCRVENDSQVAANSPQVAAAAALPPVVARVVQSTGNVTATQPGKEARSLAVGSALYEGDAVRSAAGGTAVLGFRDQTRVSVNPETVMRIESFVYNRPQTPNNSVLSLLKGGLRAFTGLIGKQSSAAFSVRTRTSTIGIRGTGMDISCEGPCVDSSLGESPPPPPDPSNPRRADGLFMRTWEGGTFFEVGPLDVPLDKAGFIGADGAARLLPAIPDFFADFGSPRPDQVGIDWDALFAVLPSNEADGLYVYVRDGSVFLLGENRVDMGVGEGGYMGPNGRGLRLAPVPAFLTTDPYPIPEFFSQTTAPILQLFGVTLGQPGQEICRL